VLFKLEQGDEGLVATWVSASIYLIVLVLENMISEGSLGGEGLSATFMIADEGTFLGMNSHVVLKGV